MHTIHFSPDIQTEKAHAMPIHTLFSSIAKTLRILQLCTSLLLLYWILTRLSFALQIFRLYFHSLAGLIGSPLFVFFISNAIIATLVANSRRLIGQKADGDNVEMKLFRELMDKNADRTESPSEVDADQSRVAEQMEYQDKQIVSDNTTARTLADQVEFDTCTDTDSSAELEPDQPKVYRRSQSENLTGAYRKEERRNLLRSETEKCRETTRPGENARESLHPHDMLSNEEFQRKIEAFIARQMRFLREESLAIVVREQS